ncbi:phage major capsid protein, partial [Xenorhabdus bovienii]
KAEIKVDKATAIDDIRLAMLQAQLALLPPSAIVTHFVDWATVELIKDGMGRYLLSNPQGYTSPTLWGLPVIATDVAAFRGKFLVGAFDSAAQIFDREQVNVVISSENEDDFGKNMISIRCEERLAL